MSLSDVSSIRQSIGDISICGPERIQHIQRLADAAIEYIQAQTNRSVIRTQYLYEITNPGKRFHLPYGPVVDIQTVEHAAAPDDKCNPCYQELLPSQYDYSDHQFWLRGCCCPKYPEGCCSSIRISYEAGPVSLQGLGFLAVSQVVSHWLLNRSGTSELTMKEVPMTVSALIKQLRIRRLRSARSSEN